MAVMALPPDAKRGSTKMIYLFSIFGGNLE